MFASGVFKTHLIGTFLLTHYNLLQEKMTKVIIDTALHLGFKWVLDRAEKLMASQKKHPLDYLKCCLLGCICNLQLV
jgi:hypothetical protein